MARVDRVEAVDRQRDSHANGVGVSQPNRILPSLERLHIPAPVMGITLLRSAVYENLYLGDLMMYRLRGRDA